MHTASKNSRFFRAAFRRSTAPVRILWLLTLLLAGALPATAFAQPQFTGNDMLTSDSGYFSVNWEASGPVVLELSRDGSFTSPQAVYEGRNSQVFLSGLQDGDYALRLRGADGSLSRPLMLSVRHQSVDRALLLVTLGALAFLATLFVILRGARDE